MSFVNVYFRFHGEQSKKLIRKRWHHEHCLQCRLDNILGEEFNVFLKIYKVWFDKRVFLLRDSVSLHKGRLKPLVSLCFVLVC